MAAYSTTKQGQIMQKQLHLSALILAASVIGTAQANTYIGLKAGIMDASDSTFSSATNAGLNVGSQNGSIEAEFTVTEEDMSFFSIGYRQAF